MIRKTHRKKNSLWNNFSESLVAEDNKREIFPSAQQEKTAVEIYFEWKILLTRGVYGSTAVSTKWWTKTKFPKWQ